MEIIYLDFDNTVVESNKRVIEILNMRYGLNKTENDLIDYGYHSIYPLLDEEEKLAIFESDEFFTGLEFKPDVISTILKYMQDFKIVVTTKGTSLNLSKKKKWIEDNMPFGLGFIGINNDSLSKKSVDMEDGIQIDDNIDALDTNASIKILYTSGNTFPWQCIRANQEVFKVCDWKDIDEILMFYKNYDYQTLEKKER